MHGLQWPGIPLLLQLCYVIETISHNQFLPFNLPLFCILDKRDMIYAKDI